MKQIIQIPKHIFQVAYTLFMCHYSTLFFYFILDPTIIQTFLHVNLPCAYLPQLLQLVDLLGGYLSCPELVLISRNLDEPR